MRKWVIVAFALAAASAARAETPVRNILIIGWDGCQRAHLKEMIDRKEVPNLMALAREGKMVDITVTTGATDTKAGWSQILTGYRPEVTGVYSNGRFQPIPKGYTIFERAEKENAKDGKDGVYTAMIVAKSGHVDNNAGRKVAYNIWLRNSSKGPMRQFRPKQRLRRLGATVEDDKGEKYVVIPGKPWAIAQNGMDLFRNGLNTNERVGALAMETIEKNKDGRFLLFVHFARPDHDGHQHGENSDQYTAGVKEDDAWTGKVIQKLKDLDLYKDTLVYIVADHGFDEGKTSHRAAPYVFMATNGKGIIRDGDRADIAPTVLKRFGVDIAKLEPKLSGSPLDEPRKTARRD